eukprot:c6654_g1_i1.p1 GENE.c6654_g1_i1~~c6654_g1_i1.p1  ORF type:complete len:301 (+),score=41.47 c6654_g1_i1:87-905(+)
MEYLKKENPNLFEDDPPSSVDAYLDPSQRDFCACCFGDLCDGSPTNVHKAEYDEFMKSSHSPTAPEHTTTPPPPKTSQATHTESFDEPTPYCMHGHDCPERNKCVLNHPNMPTCRDGAACSERTCHFNHPASWIRSRRHYQPAKFETPPIHFQPSPPSNHPMLSPAYDPCFCSQGFYCRSKTNGCVMNHPDSVDCRNGLYCQRADCKFNHPPQWIHSLLVQIQQRDMIPFHPREEPRLQVQPLLQAYVPNNHFPPPRYMPWNPNLVSFNGAR